VTRPGDARAAGDAAVRVRASALFVARWGGRLSEVYVADDERAFDDGAWFATQRVYRRDPAHRRLGPCLCRLHRPASWRPAMRRRTPTCASSTPPRRRPGPTTTPTRTSRRRGEAVVALAAAHGPYVSLEQRTTGLTNAAEDGEGDAVTRRVVDLRTGAEASLAELFGPGAADAVARAVARRSPRPCAPAPGRPARRARRRRARGRRLPADSSAARLGRRVPARPGGRGPTLRFDAANFGLSEVAGGRPSRSCRRARRRTPRR
jgi:hypothetical protein